MIGTDDFYRSVKAATSRSTGERLEDWLSVFFGRLDEFGLAAIAKTPEPYRQIGGLDGKGSFRAVRTAKAQSDFAGVLAGGKAVYIEAKATSGDSMSRSRLRPDQQTFLDKRVAMGAVVLVALGFELPTGKIDVYTVPWKVWRAGAATCNRTMMLDNKLPDILVWQTAKQVVNGWRDTAGEG